MGEAEKNWWPDWLRLPSAGSWLQDAKWQPRSTSSGIVASELSVTVGDGDAIQCGILAPAHSNEPAPVVIVPFYRVATVTGEPDPEGAWTPGSEDARRRSFARHLAQRGIVAVAVPWWFETHKARGVSATRSWAAAAATHRQRLPEVTALGRSVADLIAVVDSLGEVPVGDSSRLGCLGHSLGGKLALFLAAIDDRVKATVVSEPGLSFDSTNWNAPWYLGDHLPAHRDLDDLIVRIAPRRLLCVVGGDTDGAHTAHILERAKARTAGTPGWLSTFVHAEGHTPSWPALDYAYQFLSDSLTA